MGNFLVFTFGRRDAGYEGNCGAEAGQPIRHELDVDDDVPEESREIGQGDELEGDDVSRGQAKTLDPTVELEHGYAGDCHEYVEPHKSTWYGKGLKYVFCPWQACELTESCQDYDRQCDERSFVQSEDGPTLVHEDKGESTQEPARRHEVLHGVQRGDFQGSLWLHFFLGLHSGVRLFV